MRFLALQTNRKKLIESYCSENECVVLTTNYHGLAYIMGCFKEIIFTAAIFAIAATGIIYGWPVLWTIVGATALWFVSCFFTVLKTCIDWMFDMFVITTDKVIIVDQTSVFKQEINPIHVENIGAIITETQFWDMFGFGCVTLELKEGLGGENIRKPYIPNHRQVAEQLTNVVTKYQRGERFEPFRSGHESRGIQADETETERAAEQAAEQAAEKLIQDAAVEPQSAPVTESAPAPNPVASVE